MRVGPEIRRSCASHYDGSLESYNNDFVDQVAWVLNTVFGQQAGYPLQPGRMIRDGAHNERWFKNFIRGHQIPTRGPAVGLPAACRGDYRPERAAQGRISGELAGEELSAWLRIL